MAYLHRLLLLTVPAQPAFPNIQQQAHLAGLSAKFLLIPLWINTGNFQVVFDMKDAHHLKCLWPQKMLSIVCYRQFSDYRIALGPGVEDNVCYYYPLRCFRSYKHWLIQSPVFCIPSFRQQRKVQEARGKWMGYSGKVLLTWTFTS